MNEEILKLIDLLTEKTKNRGVIWNETSIENQYKVNFGDSYVLIDQRWNGMNYDIYSFQLRNKEGKILDSIDTEDQHQYYEQLRELFANIVNAYYKVEETYKSIFMELMSKAKVGKVEDPPEKQKPTQISDDDLPF